MKKYLTATITLHNPSEKGQEEVFEKLEEAIEYLVDIYQAKAEIQVIYQRI